MHQNNEPNPGRIRILVGDERKFLWNPLSNVIVVCRIKGPISEKRLRNAINKAKEIHPLLSSRVVYDEDNKAYFYNDHVPEIPLRVVEWKSDNQWQEELNYENRIPFKIFKGPLIRFVLIKSSEVSDFMVYGQHAICDGRALVYLIRDMLYHTAEPDREVKRLPLPPNLSSEGLSPYSLKKSSLKESLRTSLKKFMINRMNKKWRNDLVLFDQNDFENIHKAYWNENEYRIELLELSEGQTSNLISRCREQGVTVNSALSTAFLAAHHHISGPFKGKNRNVALPIDLRGRMKVPDVFCLYISRVIFQFDYNPKRNFWQNVKRFHDTATNNINSAFLFEPLLTIEQMDPTLIDAIASFGILAETVPPGFTRYDKLSTFASDKNNEAIKLAHRFLKLSPGTVMTNLGNPDVPDVYGDIKVEKMYFAPSTDERFPLVIGALTAGGKLVVTLNYVEESRIDEMKKIRDMAFDLLEV
ncbi:MAG TPA: condensation domain-containing protein [Methanobacterium sp.]|nr:condensation domain-containing protein [Methanobacterium sp.]